MDKKCIGVDVGGTSVKIGLFEEVREWEFPDRCFPMAPWKSA